MPLNAYIVNFPTSASSIFDGMHFPAGFRYPSGHQINELCKDGSGLKFWKQYVKFPDTEGQTLTFEDVKGLLLTEEEDKYRGTTQPMLKVIYDGDMTEDKITQA